VAEEYRIWQPK